jgi:hypothetical protein
MVMMQLHRRAFFATISLTLVAAVAACDGTATGNVPFTGIVGPTGNGGAGGSGGAIAGTYALVSYNGDPPSDTVVSDSFVVANDSTNIYRATLDSAYIVLHSDSTMNQYNYLTVEDKLIIQNVCQVCTVAPFVIADTLPGTYVFDATAATVTITVSATTPDSGGVVPNAAYALSFATDTLSGNIGYNVTDLLNNFVQSNTAAFVFVVNGTGPAQSKTTRYPVINGIRKAP